MQQLQIRTGNERTPGHPGLQTDWRAIIHLNRNRMSDTLSARGGFWKASTACGMGDQSLQTKKIYLTREGQESAGDVLAFKI